MVKNFKDWCKAVEAERAKLYAVADYLSDDGHARLDAFSAMCELIDLSDSAANIVDWYNNENLRSQLPREQLAALTSFHLSSPLNRLLKIAEEDNDE